MGNRALDWLAHAEHDLSHAGHALEVALSQWIRCRGSSRLLHGRRGEAGDPRCPAYLQLLPAVVSLIRQQLPEALRQCAERLKAQCAEVRAVHLFGSFADGIPTPRSDADVVIEIAEADANARQHVREIAMSVFLEAPIPVDLFVLSSAQLEEAKRSGRGIAGAVARSEMRLG